MTEDQATIVKEQIKMAKELVAELGHLRLMVNSGASSLYEAINGLTASFEEAGKASDRAAARMMWLTVALVILAAAQAFGAIAPLLMSQQ